MYGAALIVDARIRHGIDYRHLSRGPNHIDTVHQVIAIRGERLTRVTRLLSACLLPRSQSAVYEPALIEIVHKVVLRHDSRLARYFVAHSRLYLLWCTGYDVGYLFGIHRNNCLNICLYEIFCIFASVLESRLAVSGTSYNVRLHKSNVLFYPHTSIVYSSNAP